MSDTQTSGIYKAMVQVMRSVDAIGKTQSNKQQGWKFRGIDDVMNALHGAMAEYGIFVIPEISGTATITERRSAADKALYHCIQNFKYHLVAEDGSEVVITMAGEASDSGDKVIGKCSAYAMKYALLQAFMIPTADMVDPDLQTNECKPSENKLPPKVVAPNKEHTVSDIVAKLSCTEADFLKFMLETHWLNAGQTLADLSQSAINRIVNNMEGAVRAKFNDWKGEQNV